MPESRIPEIFAAELVILFSLAFYGAYKALETVEKWIARRARRQVVNVDAKRRERAMAAIAEDDRRIQ